MVEVLSCKPIVAIDLSKIKHKLERMNYATSHTTEWKVPLALPWDIDNSWRTANRDFETGEFEQLFGFVDDALELYWGKIISKNTCSFPPGGFPSALQFHRQEPIVFSVLGINVEKIDWRHDSVSDGVKKNNDTDLTSIRLIMNVKSSVAVKRIINITNCCCFRMGGTLTRKKNSQKICGITFNAIEVTNKSNEINKIMEV